MGIVTMGYSTKETEYRGKRDLVQYKRDLRHWDRYYGVQYKRDLVQYKRDLVQHKRDLRHGDRYYGGTNVVPGPAVRSDVAIYILNVLLLLSLLYNTPYEVMWLYIYTCNV